MRALHCVNPNPHTAHSSVSLLYLGCLSFPNLSGLPFSFPEPERSLIPSLATDHFYFYTFPISLSFASTWESLASQHDETDDGLHEPSGL